MSRLTLLTFLIANVLQAACAFAPPASAAFTRQHASGAHTTSQVVASGLAFPIPSATTSLNMLPPIESSLLLAETEAWVQPFASFLDPFLNLMSFAMLARVVLSWYPKMELKEAPWIFLVIPTEPFLRVVKGVIPPAFGVDITPVFWLGIFTFIHEILLGQQGLLTMKIKYGL